ncbi:PAS domain-containing protein [Streptomyces sp. NPDC018029]|uniref:PAS domain-containing protein n=1 Tax=Streptomyces sp. NPDC018029 TaxID=3365032 RepID=UPI00379B9445
MSSRPSRGAARLAAILDALPDALVLVNANGTVVNANAIALEAFETPGTALVGRGLLDLLPEFDSRLIPGSMRRPDTIDERGRTKPTRMTARRTDGSEFPVEVTSSPLEDGRDAYDQYGYTGDELLMLVVRDLSGTVDTEAELARSQRQTEMILRAAAEGVVGTDTDGRVVLVNPAAAQILGFRASDLGGRELHPLVLHSRADGEPFPYEESPLADTLRSGRKHRVRGQVLWSKSGAKVPVDLTTSPVRDGDQLVGAVMTFTDRRPYDELNEKYEAALARHAEELTAAAEERAAEIKAAEEQRAEALAAEQERYAALAEREKDRFEELAEREKARYDALAARHEQLLAVLGSSLRGPLDELRRELAALASDDAGQLWPEANQVLHHLSAGYARMTTLVDNVLGYQRLDAGAEQLSRTRVMLDAVVAAGVEGAVELIGPGRAQFAVHAPPIELVADAERLATAVAHLVADVVGIDATGNTRAGGYPGGYADSTVVVAAAQRGEVVRIEVRGPYSGGDPVHEPIVRGIVRAHGGVLQTHEVPGMGGSAYVLEVPIGAGPTEGASSSDAPGSAGSSGSAGAAGSAGSAGSLSSVPSGGAAPGSAVVVPEQASATSGGGRRRARRPSVDSFLESASSSSSAVPGAAGSSGGAGAESDTDGSGSGVAGAQGAAQGAAPSGGTGRRRGRRAAEASSPETLGGAVATELVSGPGTGTQAAEAASGGTGRRRGRPSAAEGTEGTEGAVMTAAEHAAGSAALGETVPPQGVPVPNGPTGRRARRTGEQHALPALASGPAETSGAAGAVPGTELAAVEAGHGDAARPTGRRARRALAAARERAAAEEANNGRVFALPPATADRAPGQDTAGQEYAAVQGDTGHHAAAVRGGDDHTPPQPHPVQAPPHASTQAASQAPTGRRARQAPPGGPAAPAASGTPAQGTPAQGTPAQGVPSQGVPSQGGQGPRGPQQGGRGAAAEPGPLPAPQPWPDGTTPAQGIPTPAHGAALPPERGAQARAAQPLPAETAPGAPGAPGDPNSTQGRAISVRTLGQGVPFSRQIVEQQRGPQGGAQGGPQGGPQGGGGPAVPGQGQQPPRNARIPESPQPPLPPQTPHAPQTPPSGQTAAAAGVGPMPAPQAPAPAPAPGPEASPTEPQQQARTPGQTPAHAPAHAPGQTPAQPQAAAAQSHTLGGSGRRRRLATPPEPAADGRPDASARPHPLPQPQPHAPSHPQPSAPAHPQSRIGSTTEGAGRSYAIGAPDEDADEGPEPLDGPGGAVEVANRPQPQPMDDELPPEPLDNPRRLLVWPAPDATTQQALSDRGYRPVIVHSREEVDAQIAAFPAALFVDPLTGPITRTALQSLRQAAVAAEVPVLVTAGLGQATREAAYGADPAVLLKALAPRDSEQHPSRVLLIEEHEEIALALTATLERRGMQVARAESDADAVTLAAQMRPNLVVMDLFQVRRRRAGIVDWLRANGQLNRTPLVVYTAAVDETELPKLAAGESVLFLAERSTSTEVQSRIVDLLAKIGTN